MKNLASPYVIKEILAKNSFRFSKSLGQNFLIDENVLDAIITNSQIDSNSNVLEIGPGFGTLTQRLCEKAKKVVSVEIDSTVIPILEDNLKESDNINIVNKDIMKTDILALIRENFGDESVKVCANLPYYITTPVIMALLSPNLPITDITVMIQKEVAQRVTATPCTKDYGVLTVSCGYYANAKIIANAPPSSFMPQPKVSSAVVRFEVLEKPPVFVKSDKTYFKVVRSAFAMRRKTLLNTLAKGDFGMTKEQVESILKNIGIDPSRRGETLNFNEFASIANAFDDMKGCAF